MLRKRDGMEMKGKGLVRAGAAHRGLRVRDVAAHGGARRGQPLPEPREVGHGAGRVDVAVADEHEGRPQNLGEGPDPAAEDHGDRVLDKREEHCHGGRQEVRKAAAASRRPVGQAGSEGVVRALRNQLAVQGQENFEELLRLVF